MQLSEHFTLAEATFSSTAARLGIDNSCADEKVIAVATYTAARMERVRFLLRAKGIHIDSWIRCLLLNRALGSKDTSQHPLGEAVDFLCNDFGTPLEICQQIIKYQELIDFDQLILEHSWVHISFKKTGNRRQVLSLLTGGHYAQGLTDSHGKSY